MTDTQDVIYQWGSVQFSPGSIAPQTVNRSQEWSWPEQQLIGAMPEYQFTGAGSETLVMEGIVFPEVSGNSNPLATLRALADAGTEANMVTSGSRVLGKFVLKSISESIGLWFRGGVPRRISYTLTFQKVANAF